MKKVFCLAAALALSAAAPASASTVQLTITGVVSWYSTDDLGLFGGSSFNASTGAWSNLPIQIVVGFDTSQGGFEGNIYGSHFYGGTYYGLPTASLGATVTTNGHSLGIAGTYQTTWLTVPTYTEIVVADANRRLHLYLPSVPIDQPFSGTYETSATFRGTIDPGSYATPIGFLGTGLDVVPVSAVPIPPVGTGLPALLAGYGLLAWWRTRRERQPGVGAQR